MSHWRARIQNTVSAISRYKKRAFPLFYGFWSVVHQHLDPVLRKGQRKWRQFIFSFRAIGGVVVKRFSSHPFAKRVFSFLGFVTKPKIVRGETVAMLDIDASRRTFLKYALFGSAVFVAGKYVNPIVNLIRGDTVLSEKTFENFKVTETGRRLLVTDDDGSEVLIIDKESF